MAETDVIKAINYLDSAIKKSEDFDVLNLEMSDRVLDNRIITLEGYIRYIDREGIPKLKSFIKYLEGDIRD